MVGDDDRSGQRLFLKASGQIRRLSERREVSHPGRRAEPLANGGGLSLKNQPITTPPVATPMWTGTADAECGSDDADLEGGANRATASSSWAVGYPK